MATQSKQEIDRPLQNGYFVTMTATELVVEKAKHLSEVDAELVLAYIDELAVLPRLSAFELTQLPPAQRRAILEKQAAKADAVYRSDPDLICEDADGPLPYG